MPLGKGPGRRKEKAPLLGNSKENASVASDGEVLSRQRRRGVGRLFSKSPQPTSRERGRRNRAPLGMDQGDPRVPKAGILLQQDQVSTQKQAQPVSQSESLQWQQQGGQQPRQQQRQQQQHQNEATTIRNTTSITPSSTMSSDNKTWSTATPSAATGLTTPSTTGPVMALPENSRDSVKKARPYAVSIRKTQSNPIAQDPPAPKGPQRGIAQPPTTRSAPPGPEPTSFLNMMQPAASQGTSFLRNEEEKKTDDASTVTDNKSLDSHHFSRHEEERRIHEPVSPSHVASKLSARIGNLNNPKAMLTRAFGRNSLPPDVVRRWVVEVSSAEWDADEHRWKYRILVQQRQLAGQKNNDEYQRDERKAQKSFTTAFTWRSVGDFLWLEEALRKEFHGGLLVPVLGIALGQATDSNLEGMPVEAEKLRNWFSDILNGVRGQGELILDYNSTIDLLKSESMEAFLYRNSGPLDLTDHPVRSGPNTPNRRMGNDGDSLVQKLLLGPLELCLGPDPAKMTVADSRDHAMQSTSHRKRAGYGGAGSMIPCTSAALSSAPSLDVYDSFAEPGSIATSSRAPLAIHSEILDAQRNLSLYYRKMSLSTMEKLQGLREEEERIGGAWKRFAIAVANLFAYEKDVENAKIGESRVTKENLPYRKVAKDAVDECLRVLARQYVDRSVPALSALNDMLSAYAADWHAVHPAVEMYAIGMNKISKAAEKSLADLDVSRSSSSWEERFRNTMEDVRKKTLRSFGQNEEIHDAEDSDSIQIRTRKEQARLLNNERLLQRSLSDTCRSVPLRAARMAWKYWNIEASQCALLNSAAISLRSKVDIAKRDAVMDMFQRHMREDEEDRRKETDLVHRIVDIGNRSKGQSGDASSVAEEDFADEASPERSQLRMKAIDMARSRIGKWDAAMAMSLMQAVGVTDPNVLVEETTRELRLIRKYAIGLRENLTRCLEAANSLKEIIGGQQANSSGNDKSQRMRGKSRIVIRREEFTHELLKLLSGTFASTEGQLGRQLIMSQSALKRAKVEINDPYGWLPTDKEARPAPGSAFFDGRLGDLAIGYMEARNAKTEELLSSLYLILEDYKHRVETVEGFVYMQCVGIQLEKHCSQRRAAALAAFEKKTDITSAINVARKKRMPQLVTELQKKLLKIGPNVSHTEVKVTKEMHLESKNLKADLNDLAMRRLMRARETSTERVVLLLSGWAKEEEGGSTAELRALGEALAVLEQSIRKEDAEMLLTKLTNAGRTTK